MTGRSYTQNFFKVQYIIIQAILGRKLMKKNLRLPMKKSIRLLTVENNSHADMSTSHAQFLGKGCQHGEEDSKIKFCHKKSASPVKNQIIEIIFLFCLPAV